MSDPAFWFPWLKLVAFALGLLVGSFAVGSPSWVWLRRQVLNASAVILALFGTILMSMSIWTSIQIETLGFKALFEQIASLSSSIQLNNAMSNIRLAELEAFNDIFQPQLKTIASLEELAERRESNDPGLVNLDPSGPFYGFGPTKRVPTQLDFEASLVGISALQLIGKYELDRFKTVLAEFPRDEAPLKWAEAQILLGNLLLAVPVSGAGLSGESVSLHWDTLVTDEKKEDRRERLGEARKAFEAALEVLNKEEEPLDWAKATSGIATSLYLQAKTQEPPDIEGIRDAIELWNQCVRVLDELGADAEKSVILALLNAATVLADAQRQP